MANPGILCKGYMQIGREVTWGTAAAATKLLPIMKHTIRQEFIDARDESLFNGNVIRNIKHMMEYAEGDIEALLTYNELLMLFGGAYGTGTYGSNGETVSGANPYTHTFLDQDFFNSYTLELIEGNIPASKCQRVLGAKIASFKITGEVPGYVKCSFHVIGKQMQTNQTPTGALSAATPLYVLTAHATAANGAGDFDGTGDAAADQILRSWEFEHVNSIKLRPGAGSSYTLEPIRTGRSMSRIKMTKEFRKQTVMDNWIAETRLSGPGIIFSSSPSSLQFSIQTASITNFDMGEGSDGLMVAVLDAEAINSGTYTPSKVIVVNAQATEIA